MNGQRKTTLAFKIIKRLSIVIAVIIAVAVGASWFGMKAYYLNYFYYDKAEDIALTAAKQVEALISAEIEKGKFTADDFLSFKYRELSLDECLQIWGVPADRDKYTPEYLDALFKNVDSRNPAKVEDYRRYMTKYGEDADFGNALRGIIDGFMVIRPKGLMFAATMDKNGFVPFHHAIYSMKLTGDLKKDIAQCRSNRIWDYLGRAIKPSGINKFLYRRDTGAEAIMVAAPVSVNGQFWGGVVVGYDIKDIYARIYSATAVIIGIIISGTLIIFLGINIMIKKSLQPIVIISDILHSVARGDFTRHITFVSDDEIGDIARNSNLMIEQSAKTIDYLKGAAASLAASSEELTATSVSLGNSSSSQVHSVRDISSELNLVLDSIGETTEYIGDQVNDISSAADSITGLEDMSNRIADNMKYVKKQSEDSIEIARKGEDVGTSASSAMKHIVESTHRINEMVTMINDISDQINLLSLNASIEAARAGEAGRGFAVVAEEIGKLADNTTAQVKQIQLLSSEIGHNVQEGEQMVLSIRESISSIIRKIIENSTSIEEIALLTEQQAKNHTIIKETMQRLEEKSRNIIDVATFQKSNSESMKEAINRIKDFATESASGAEEIAASSEELSSRAEDLSNLIEGFKTKAGDPGDGIRIKDGKPS